MFADILKTQMTLKNVDAVALSHLAGLDVTAVRALVAGDGTWASACRAITGLRQLGPTGRLKIKANISRKLTVEHLAAKSGVAPSTVSTVRQFISYPSDLSQIRMDSIEKVLAVVGGSIILE